jgi:Ca2+/Na+ antiporter
MNKRPHSVTAIGCIFIVAGVIGLAYHGAEFKTQRHFDYDSVWVLLVRLLAIIGGVFLLRGSDWARWFLLIWIAYHVILSAFHSVFELITHSLLFAVIVYFLYRPRVSAYFRDMRAGTAHQPRKDDTPVA